ncbi:hypothetical protein PR048_025720 [Dryococelus australis]|uniref:Uncharacterized protein n=1 Tax=Dryococelus australis TaxID=614101 RepID=A0ABQ9GJB2_9NEOP|nr:hypothetical protein PR048_025720 [Dryococelus australis]
MSGTNYAVRLAANQLSALESLSLRGAVIEDSDNSMLASHQGETRSIPGRITPGFLHMVIVPDDASGGRPFSEISHFPRSFIPALLRAQQSPASALKTSFSVREGVSSHPCGSQWRNDAGFSAHSTVKFCLMPNNNADFACPYSYAFPFLSKLHFVDFSATKPCCGDPDRAVCRITCESPSLERRLIGGYARRLPATLESAEIPGSGGRCGVTDDVVPPTHLRSFGSRSQPAALETELLDHPSSGRARDIGWYQVTLHPGRCGFGLEKNVRSRYLDVPQFKICPKTRIEPSLRNSATVKSQNACFYSVCVVFFLLSGVSRGHSAGESGARTIPASHFLLRLGQGVLTGTWPLCWWFARSRARLHLGPSRGRAVAQWLDGSRLPPRRTGFNQWESRRTMPRVGGGGGGGNLSFTPRPFVPAFSLHFTDSQGLVVKSLTGPSSLFLRSRYSAPLVKHWYSSGDVGRMSREPRSVHFPFAFLTSPRFRRSSVCSLLERQFPDRDYVRSYENSPPLPPLHSAEPAHMGCGVGAEVGTERGGRVCALGCELPRLITGLPAGRTPKINNAEKYEQHFGSSACAFYTRQNAKSKYRNRIRLEGASQKPFSDTHKIPYDRVKRCRERKINIKASERVNVDVFTQNKRPSEKVTAVAAGSAEETLRIFTAEARSGVINFDGAGIIFPKQVRREQRRAIAPSYEGHTAQSNDKLGKSEYSITKWSHCGRVVRLLASHLFEQGLIPSGVAPRLSHVSILPDYTSVIEEYRELGNRKASSRSNSELLSAEKYRVSEQGNTPSRPNKSYVIGKQLTQKSVGKSASVTASVQCAHNSITQELLSGKVRECCSVLSQTMKKEIRDVGIKSRRGSERNVIAISACVCLKVCVRMPEGYANRHTLQQKNQALSTCRYRQTSTCVVIDLECMSIGMPEGYANRPTLQQKNQALSTCRYRQTSTCVVIDLECMSTGMPEGYANRPTLQQKNQALSTCRYRQTSTCVVIDLECMSISYHSRLNEYSLLPDANVTSTFWRISGYDVRQGRAPLDLSAYYGA